MRTILGVDAGTSVVKAVAFSFEGEVLRSASRPTPVLSPAPGRAEQDVEATLRAVGEAMREAAGDETPDLIGITAQGDGLWLMDEDGRAPRPAILWSDGRAAAHVERWQADGTTERVFRRTGSAVFAGAAAAILRALADEEPDVLARAAHAGSCTDVVVRRFAGVRATDPSDAPLPLFDPAARRYAPDLLDAFGLEDRAGLLPPVDPFPTPLRALDDAGAALSGLPVGTPLHAGPFDFCAAVIGAGVTRPGDALVALGTTIACGVLVDRPATDGEPAGMLRCLPQPDRWVRLLPAMVGTPSLEWLLDLLGARREEIDALLAASPAGAGGVLCLPLLSPAGERAPFVDAAARGAFLGLSTDAGRADLVRALCEGIAFAARQCLETAGLIADGRVFLSGGGLRSPGWRQLLADVLGRPLLLARQPEVGARGAAVAALEAAGVAFDRDRDRDHWTRPEGAVEPDRARAAFYDDAYAAYRDRLAAARQRWAGPRP